MSKEHNAILYSTVDREDYWVTGGLAFKVDGSLSYTDAYNILKPKLESKEIIDYIIDEHCLIDDVFDGDETFKFVDTYWDGTLVYRFENESGEEADFSFTETDFIFLAD